jgi:dTDP-4-amino-4,6-dideoxygalactose transaminase
VRATGHIALGKRRIDDLAIFGKAPAFFEKLHVGGPNVSGEDRFMARVRGALATRRLSNQGPLTEEFEQKMSAFLGVRHCVAVCNATMGLQLAAKALELRGEFIVPAFTFVATVHALSWLGLKPVFCDVDPVTHNIDPACARRLVSSDTSAILGVHLWGGTCDIGALTELCKEHGLALLFDAAHAFACSQGGQMVGGNGRAEVFSFHATKVINTFEGGMVATNDDELADRLRLFRNFGFEDMDRVVAQGINCKMNEIGAAMGLTGLEDLDDIVAANRRNHDAYRSMLDGIPGIRLCRPDQDEKSNYNYVVVDVDSRQAGLGRDHIMTALQAENIIARRYFYPGCHRMEPYRSQASQIVDLPITNGLTGRLLQLPTGLAMDEGRIAKVCDLVRLISAEAPAVATKLGSNRSIP